MCLPATTNISRTRTRTIIISSVLAQPRSTTALLFSSLLFSASQVDCSRGLEPTQHAQRRCFNLPSRRLLYFPLLLHCVNLHGRCILSHLKASQPPACHLPFVKPPILPGPQRVRLHKTSGPPICREVVSFSLGSWSLSVILHISSSLLFLDSLFLWSTPFRDPTCLPASIDILFPVQNVK